MTTPTPGEELRRAAARLRDDRNCDNNRLDSTSRELLEMIVVLLRSREPLAAWLESTAALADAFVSLMGDADVTTGEGPIGSAVRVARAVNGQQVDGLVQPGRIVDHLDPAETLRGIHSAAGAPDA